MNDHVIISTKKLYSGEISLRTDKFDLRGEIVEKEVVEHSDSVGIIPLDANKNIIFVKQFRIATRKVLMEIPAGKIERGETPEHAARREMNEEIGYSGKLAPLFQCYLAPGYDTEKMYFFIATNLKKFKKRLQRDKDEEIRINRLKISSALKRCISGKIEDCKTIAAILMISQLEKQSSKNKKYQ